MQGDRRRRDQCGMGYMQQGVDSICASAKLTKTDPVNVGLLDVFQIDKEDIHWLPSAGTTSIRNLYLSADRERRE